MLKHARRVLNFIKPQFSLFDIPYKIFSSNVTCNLVAGSTGGTVNRGNILKYLAPILLSLGSNEIARIGKQLTSVVPTYSLGIPIKNINKVRGNSASKGNTPIFFLPLVILNDKAEL